MSRAPLQTIRVLVLAPILLLAPTGPVLAQPSLEAETVIPYEVFLDRVGLDLDVDARGRVHVLHTDDEGGGSRALVHSIRQPGGWTRERIASIGGGVGDLSADMVLDGDGRVHVVLLEVFLDRLDYFVRDVGVWSRETIEADSAYTRAPVIDVDPGTGDVVVYAKDPFSGDLHRFTRTPSGWSEGIQMNLSASGLDFDFAFGPDPISFVMYADEVASQPILRRTDTFAILDLTLVDGSERLESQPDIAIGPDGRAHVTGIVYDPEVDRLKTLYHYGGETEYLLPWDTSLSRELESKIAVDGSGRVHLFAQREIPRVTGLVSANFRTFYHVREDGFWRLEAELATRTVPVALDVGLFGNPQALIRSAGNLVELHTGGLFLDSQVGGEVLKAGSVVDVEWFGPGPVDVQLSTDGGSTWTTLARNAVGGSAPVSVPYVETDRARMRVVRTEPYAESSSLGDFTIVRGLDEGWATAPVVSAAPGSRIDLEVGDDGTVHAAWIDPDALVLSYGVFAQGQWTTEVVDAGNEPVARPALALAPDGTPVIAYVEKASEVVRLARRTGGVWSTPDVPDTDGTTFDVDVLVAADGTTHLAFYDGVRQQLVHAQQAAPGSSWTVTDDLAGQAGFGRGFDLEDDGQSLWIVFRDDSSGSGLNVVQRPLSGGAWTGDWYPLGDEETFDPELEIDTDGALHVLCRRVEAPVDARIVWGRFDAGGWTLETLPGTVDGAELPLDFALDRDGRPVALFNDAGRVVLARRVQRERWTLEEITDGADPLGVPGLVIGRDGQPRVLGVDAVTGQVVDRFRGLDLVSPRAGDVWPVGATRTVEWFGPGRVEAQLSIDGGATWQSLGAAERGGTLELQVPQVPTRFARVRLVREAPAASIEMPGLFSVESSIALLALQAERVDEGVALQWSSDPGPDDLLGYAIDRRRDGAWTTVAEGLTRTEHVDPDGDGGDRYRIKATNGLGESFVIGETTVSATAVLRVWPRPAVDGAVQVAFDAGRARAQAEVVVHDVRGRRVRTLFGGADAPGITRLTWDGRDADGRTVATGVYFVSLRGGSADLTRKVVVVR